VDCGQSPVTIKKIPARRTARPTDAGLGPVTQEGLARWDERAGGDVARCVTRRTLAQIRTRCNRRPEQLLSIPRDQDLDELRCAIALFEIPGDQRKSEPGRRGDIDRIGPTETELRGESRCRARENVVYGDEAEGRQVQHGVRSTSRQSELTGPARHGPGHFGQEEGRGDH
jgi:hypothetical protein